MEFMGIGPLEILLILILGFLFFGPEKLPEMAAKAGRLYRNLRKAKFDLSRSISEDLSSEKSTLSTDLSKIGKSITGDLSKMGKSITEDLSEIGKSISEDLSSDNKKASESNTTPSTDEKVSVENSQSTTPSTETNEKPDEQ